MKKINKKFILILASVAVLLLATVGGTVAYIVTNTPSILNTFNPSKVTCEVIEGWQDGNTRKSNVTVKNTGDTYAYIRVAIVGNWVNKNGHIVESWTVDSTKFTGFLGAKWKQCGDYYYYTEPVAPGNETDTLFTEYDAPQDRTDGAHLEMTILAQAVQSTPADAVKAAWRVSISPNGVTPITNQ